MKNINIKESLIRLDMNTDFKYTLTDLYEACRLDEKKRDQLVQYIDNKDIEGMSKMLSNEAGVMTENIPDDIPDDDMPDDVVTESWPQELTDCPECGDISFDSKNGRCTKCSYRESLSEAIHDGSIASAVKHSGYLLKSQWFDPHHLNRVSDNEYTITHDTNGGTVRVRVNKSDKDDSVLKFDVNGKTLETKSIKQAHKFILDELEDVNRKQFDLEVESFTEPFKRGDMVYVKPSKKLGRVMWVKGDYVNVEIQGENDPDRNDTFYASDLEFQWRDRLNEGPGAVLGDLAGKAVGDAWKGLKNFAKGVKDTGKDVGKTVKAVAKSAHTDWKQSKTRAKVVDAARAVKDAENVDDFKAKYKARQDGRKLSDKARTQSYKGKLGKSIGDMQDWKFEVNGKKMTYDQFMRLPQQNREYMIKNKTVKCYDLMGKPITVQDQAKRLSGLKEALLLEYSEYRRILKEASAVLDRPRVSNVHTHRGSFSGIIDAHMDEINDMINNNVPATHIVHCLRDWVSCAELTKSNAKYAQNAMMRMAKMRTAEEVGMYLYNIRLKAEDDSFGSIDSQFYSKKHKYEDLNEELLRESADEEDKPFNHSQIFDELKRETANFSIGADRGIYSFEKEVKMAEKILKKHYNDVKVTERGNDFMVEFSGPKNKKKKVNESKSISEDMNTYNVTFYMDSLDDNVISGPTTTKKIQAVSEEEAKKKLIDSSTDKYYIPTVTKVELVESVETSKEWEHKDKDGKIGRIRQSDGKGDRKPLTRDQAKEIAKFRGHEDDELYPIEEGLHLVTPEAHRAKELLHSFDMSGMKELEDKIAELTSHRKSLDLQSYEANELATKINTLRGDLAELKRFIAENNLEARVDEYRKQYGYAPVKIRASKNEAIEMTADEMKAKHGTDNPDIINVGKPEEERVALKEGSQDKIIANNIEEFCNMLGIEYKRQWGAGLFYPTSWNVYREFKDMLRSAGLGNLPFYYYHPKYDKGDPDAIICVEDDGDENIEYVQVTANSEPIYASGYTPTRQIESVNESKSINEDVEVLTTGKLTRLVKKITGLNTYKTSSTSIRGYRAPGEGSFEVTKEGLDSFRIIFHRNKDMQQKVKDELLSQGYEVYDMANDIVVKAPKNSNESLTEQMVYTDTNGFLGEPGEKYTMSQFRRMWQDKDNDPVMSGYDSFEEWVGETISQMDAHDDEEDYIDSTYHNYSEKELKKMGAFDNLNDPLAPSGRGKLSCAIFTDTNGILGEPGEKYTVNELADYWSDNRGLDPSLAAYNGNWMKWLDDTLEQMEIDMDTCMFEESLAEDRTDIMQRKTSGYDKCYKAVKKARTANPIDTKALNDARDHFGADLYKMCLDDVLKEMDNIDEAFEHPQNKEPHWYLCKHGIGPGALPKGVNIVDTVDDEENSSRVYVALDKVLTTDELKQYEVKEAKPPRMMKESLDFFDTVTVILDDDMWGGYSKELEHKYNWYQGQVMFEGDPRLKEIGAKPGDTILCGLEHTDKFGDDDINYDVVPIKVLTGI